MVSWRRGIEPVIAAVILIAVAIVVAVAVVGWIIGLWGSMAGGNPQITSNPMMACVDSSRNVKVTVYIKNSGAGSDKLISAYLDYGGNVYTANRWTTKSSQTGGGTSESGTGGTGPQSIPISSNSDMTVEIVFGSVSNIKAGDSATVRLIFERSGTQPLPITVQSCPSQNS